MKKTFLLLLLVLALLLCSCMPAISGEHTTEPSDTQSTVALPNPTDPPTQLTEPPTTEPITQPTEPTQEPTFVLSGGTPLADDEVASLQVLFQWPGYYATASHCTFSTSSELSLKQLVREGPDVERRITLSETEQEQLFAVSEGFLALDTDRISKEAVIQVLDQYYGLSLEDLSDTGSSVYLEHTDSFYYYVSDTTACCLVITQALALEDGTLWVSYYDEASGQRSGEMLLQPAGDGYQILANKTSLTS